MDFQTPKYVCDYMVGMISPMTRAVIEPTPGEGNLVRAIHDRGKMAIHPEDGEDFWEWHRDLVLMGKPAVCMNPPFTPMKTGYEILFLMMGHYDNIVALMPWLTMINSRKRTDRIMDYGLVSLTHLDRNVFKGARVQTCILNLQRGYEGKTEFKVLNKKG